MDTTLAIVWALLAAFQGFFVYVSVRQNRPKLTVLSYALGFLAMLVVGVVTVFGYSWTGVLGYAIAALFGAWLVALVARGWRYVRVDDSETTAEDEPKDQEEND